MKDFRDCGGRTKNLTHPYIPYCDGIGDIGPTKDTVSPTVSTKISASRETTVHSLYHWHKTKETTHLREDASLTVIPYHTKSQITHTHTHIPHISNMPFKARRRNNNKRNNKNNNLDIPLDDRSNIRGLMYDDFTAMHLNNTVARQGGGSTTSSLESELMMDEFEHDPSNMPTIEEYREIDEANGLRQGVLSLSLSSDGCGGGGGRGYDDNCDADEDAHCPQALPSSTETEERLPHREEEYASKQQMESSFWCFSWMGAGEWGAE
jgi:hypothetical protein